MATGYSDPLSSAFDVGTYSIEDWTTPPFSPIEPAYCWAPPFHVRLPNKGQNLVRSASSMALAKVSGANAAQTEKAVLRQVMKGGTTKAAQKTAQVAEQYMAK